MVLPKIFSKSSRKHRSTNSTSTSPSSSIFASPPSAPLDTHNNPYRRDSSPRSSASSPEKRARASADIPTGSRSGSGSAKRPPISPIKTSAKNTGSASSRRASPAPPSPFLDPFEQLDRARSPDSIEQDQTQALNHNGIGIHAAASHLSAQQRRRQSAQPAMETAGSAAGPQQDATSPRAFPPPARASVVVPEAMTPTPAADGGAPADGRPPVPPHRTQPPAVSAEECKAAGNRFFKTGDFDKAVEEYSKGWHFSLLCVRG
jgi:DnaJ family protein C protein 7